MAQMQLILLVKILVLEHMLLTLQMKNYLKQLIMRMKEIRVFFHNLT